MNHEVDYYSKYLKYKKKYLSRKNNIQDGGGKRYLKLDINQEDILTITPLGSPKIMNNFLLKPEIDFIKSKCSKDDKLKKFCKEDLIGEILTQIYKSENNNENIKHIEKDSKTSPEFINHVIKSHNQWKNDSFNSEKKSCCK